MSAPALQLRLSRRADQADDPPRHPQGDRDPRLPGAVREPRDADALRLGHRRRAGDRRDPRARRRAQGDRPGRRRHHQRGLDPHVLRQDRRRRDHHRRPRDATIIQTRHRIPETPLAESQILVYQVPIPEPLRFLEPRETETRTHARARGIRADACEALRGHRPARPYRHDLRLSGEGRRPLRHGPLADAEVRQSEDATTARRCSCSAPAARSASTRSRPTPQVVSASTSRITRSSVQQFDRPCALCGADGRLSRRGHHRRPAAAACSCAPTPTIARRGARARRPRREPVTSIANARLRAPSA